MASLLYILNESPYGSERSHNALRHALAMAEQPDVQVRVLLMADATGCALSGQKTPEGHYSIERMLKGLLAKKALVAL